MLGANVLVSELAERLWIVLPEETTTTDRPLFRQPNCIAVYSFEKRNKVRNMNPLTIKPEAEYLKSTKQLTLFCLNCRSCSAMYCHLLGACADAEGFSELMPPGYDLLNTLITARVREKTDMRLRVLYRSPTSR